MFEELRSLGFRVSLWNQSYGTHGTNTHAEASRSKALGRKKGPLTLEFMFPMAPIDFSNEGAAPLSDAKSGKGSTRTTRARLVRWDGTDLSFFSSSWK